MSNDRDREQDLHDRVVTAIGRGGLSALRDAGLAVVCLDELEKHLAELREERDRLIDLACWVQRTSGARAAVVDLIDTERGVRVVACDPAGDEKVLLREILTRLGVKANRDDITTLGARDHIAVATGNEADPTAPRRDLLGGTAASGLAQSSGPWPRRRKRGWVTAEGYTEVPQAMLADLGLTNGGSFWFLKRDQWEVWTDKDVAALLGE